MADTIREFATEADAWEFLDEQADDPCVDNHRLAYDDDALAWFDYQRRVVEGCCGSMDIEVVIAGRKARIGCNYGH